MASTFILKRVNFTLLKDGSGKTISDFKKDYENAGGQEKLGMSFTQYYRGNAPKVTSIDSGGSAVSMGFGDSAVGKANREISKKQEERFARRQNNKMIAENNRQAGFKAGAIQGASSGYKAGFNEGANSVGIKQGLVNSWNNMGTAQKIGTAAAGTVAAGLMLRGIFGGRRRRRKKDED